MQSNPNRFIVHRTASLIVAALIGFVPTLSAASQATVAATTAAVTPTPDATPYPTAVATSTEVDYGQLLTIHMITRTEGWATRGQRTNLNEISAILHTYDGGSHWIDVSPDKPLPFDIAYSQGGVEFPSFFALDRVYAWVVYGTTVLRTVDSGKTWSRAQLDFSADSISQDGVQIGTLTFADPYHGWLLKTVGNAAELYRTVDGGQSWNAVNSWSSNRLTTIPPNFPGQVLFTSGLSGWMWAMPESVKSGSNLRRTTDGGATWSVFSPPPVQIASNEIPADDCAFVDLFYLKPNALFTLGYCKGVSHIALEMFRSGNEGRTWQVNVLPAHWVACSCYFNIDMISAHDGWMIAPDSADSSARHLFRTVDGAQSWQTLALPQGGVDDNSRLDFIDAQTGWLINATGTLLFSSDAGQTWNALDSRITPVGVR